MGSTVGANQLTVVHKGTGGVVTFSPDVCKTPVGNSVVPIPYANVARAGDAAKGARSVLVEGNPVMVQGSQFSTSTGDEAGTAGGVVSGKTRGAAEFIGYSFDVQVEGKGVARANDLMLGNQGSAANTPPAPVMQAPQPKQGKGVEDLEPDRFEVTVVDVGGKPIADVRYVVETIDGQKHEGKTDGSGKIRVEETMIGVARVVFPDLPDVAVEVQE